MHKKGNGDSGSIGHKQKNWGKTTNKKQIKVEKANVISAGFEFSGLTYINGTWN